VNNQATLAEVLGTDRGQVYSFEHDGLQFHWSIDLALRIIGSREPYPNAAMTPEMVKQALASNIYSKDLDREFALTRDLSKPLIAVVSPIEFRGGNCVVLLLIDGWHRMVKAAQIGHTEPLQCHVLSREEEMACRIVKLNPERDN